MIIIKNHNEISIMKRTGNALAKIFEFLSGYIRPGINTLYLDSLIESKLSESGLVSQAKGYMGYRHASCISLNNVVVHGVPSSNCILKDGDLIKVDICAKRDGFCADMTRMFFLGQPSEEVSTFIKVAKQALNKGIEKATAGNHLSDISAAIQREVEQYGYSIVRDFAGHGIGQMMHEDPEILNYGRPGKGPLLRPGMTFALEPMITMGQPNTYIANDGWTVCTSDNSLAAHIEDTIAVTESGPCILTQVDETSEGIHN